MKGVRGRIVGTAVPDVVATPSMEKATEDMSTIRE
jgi:hypothetical protein